MNDNLANVTRTLHDLLKALPAIRERCESDVIRRHVALIAYYQRRYDRLADGLATPLPDGSAASRLVPELSLNPG